MLFISGSNTNRKFIVALGLALLLGMSACNSGSSSSGLFGNSTDSPVATINQSRTTGTFNGCLSGVGLSRSQIQINFEFAPGATIVNIYRNGQNAYSTGSLSANQFIDNGTDGTGLAEGQTYTYRCESIVGGVAVQGSNILNISTVASNPPTFAGITSVESISTHSLTVKWNPVVIPGITADYFQVFAIPVASLNGSGPQNDTTGSAIWTQTPAAHVSLGTYQAQISGLGDQMIYAIGVKAYSATGSRDENIKIITVQMNDAGAPTTPGVTTSPGADTMKAIISGGAVQIYAPWDHTMGAIAKREVWASDNFSGSFNTPYIAYTYIAPGTDYTQPPGATPTDLIAISLTAIPGVTAGLHQGTDYKFYVIDTDPVSTVHLSGTATTNTTPVTISVGDTTKPGFSAGISAIASTEDTVTATWTLGKPENLGTHDGGGYDGTLKYRVFYTVSTPANPSTPATSISDPANPCTTTDTQIVHDGGQPTQQSLIEGYNGAHGGSISLASSQGTVVSYQISGLTPRTKYSVCIKAEDTAGNISTTDPTAFKSTITADLTAPIFPRAGNVPLLSYRDNCGGNGPGLMVTFQKSEALDVNKYTFTLLKNATTPKPTSPNVSASVSALAAFTTDNLTYNYCIAVSLDPSGGAYLLNNNDTVNLWIDAWDNAFTLGYKATPTEDNHTTNGFISTNVGVIAPPTGFNGLTTAVAETLSGAKVDGAVVVSWAIAETSLVSNYAGYRIYSLPSRPVSGDTDADLFARSTLLKNCACPSSDCTSMSSCTIDGLDIRRTYYLYATVYDKSDPQLAQGLVPGSGTTPGGFTWNNLPTQKYRSVTTTDSVGPVLGSDTFINTETTISGATYPKLIWPIATDTQYISEPGAVITYILYRATKNLDGSYTTYSPKSSFAPVMPYSTNPTQPSTTPTGTATLNKYILTGGSTISYTDGAITPGATYKYQICAQDASIPANVTCDTNHILSYLVPDSDTPLVSFHFDKFTEKTWNLQWKIYDPLDGVRPTVTLYRKTGNTDTGADLPDPSSDGEIYSDTTTGTGTVTVAGSTYNARIGTYGVEDGTSIVSPGQNKYVNYLLRAHNSSSNKDTDSTVSIRIRNSTVTAPTITGIQVLSANGTSTTGHINALAAKFTGTCAGTDTNTDQNGDPTDALFIPTNAILNAKHATQVSATAVVTGSSGMSVFPVDSSTAICSGGSLSFIAHYLPGNTPLLGSPANPRPITIATDDGFGNTGTLTSSSTTLSKAYLINDFLCPLPLTTSSTALPTPPTQSWVGVPGDLSQPDFCLAKYEAKIISVGLGGAITFDFTLSTYKDFSNQMGNGIIPGSSYSTHAEIRPESAPWIGHGTTTQAIVPSGTYAGNDFLYYARAVTLCNAMGRGYHLVTDSEWQTTAKNMELQGSNWTGGSVNSGILYRGYSNSTVTAPAVPALLAASALDDTQGYYNVPGCSAFDTTFHNCSGFIDQKRTMRLSNGETVWDLAGNAKEYVMSGTPPTIFPTLSFASNATSPPTESYAIKVLTDPTTINSSLLNMSSLDSNLSSSTNAGPTEYNSTFWGAVSSLAKASFAPSDTTLSSATGAGKFTISGNGSTPTQIVRGGGANSGTAAGIFSAEDAGPITTHSDNNNGTAVTDNVGIPNTGFRCSYIPPSTAPKLAMFVTTTTYAVRLSTGGIAGALYTADNDCNGDTNKPTDGGTFKALVATSAQRIPGGAGWVLAPNTTYYRKDRSTVIGTTDGTSTFSGTLTNTVDTSASTYWTGLTPTFGAGTNSNDFNTWQGPATYGTATHTDVGGFISSGTTDSGYYLKSLLCVEQP